ncbi:lysozyme [Rhodovulum sulfidophilum]|uniref:lysozyme n=1 Tax=Rhodovulum sulfidophilum TaxID=35806 RepID=UPI0019290BAB|nr:lysozyme [Rhodovulum sulfidophilum]MBL3587628.1 lysozyme [Rhodovulum sulfidophilum]
MRKILKRGAAATALALSFIGGNEGLKTEAYLDIVGVPTVCFGETRGVELGDSYTPAECRAMFAGRLAEFEAGLDRLIADPVEALIPDRSYVGILDWAYNVGLGAAARSTLIRKLNAGDLRGACNELPRWRFAGGKGIRGLLIRRNKARQLCHEGLDGIPAEVPFRWRGA